ncbi:LuxR C-terminal-related transcriptional regulator [Actinoplanes sp. OR16]|uniref:LuxR C-terminal-related transcriptional regulator n=1 Tax=Actinoplanes sp. OR16 TaxID=946334 RepID=UPI000FDA392B|nr:LuxR C-terminal-related transcriptional regulator [Actinoplanes sp. OR16]
MEQRIVGDGEPVSGPALLLPLLAAKLGRPRMRPGVDRERLCAALDAAVASPVTVVCAGAGWGKTMLVSAWAQSRETPVAWLSLDRHDNDPQVFWAYVVAALRESGVVPAGNPLAGMGAIPADDGERVRRLADGLSRLPSPAVLVVDDFHEIIDARVLADLADLLRHPPAGLRLVLISRSQPALPLHRLRAAGHVTEIGAAQLAFTGDETATLLGGYGLARSTGEVAELLARTEGWAVGLHLSAGFLSAGGDERSVADFAGDSRGVLEYMIQEVLSGRSRRQRRFLLQTSICERVCAGLADAITADHDGQRTLERLEHDNDFVARLGERPLWFRYHPLFREALGHNLLRETPATISELHRRAARWHAGNNSVLEALEHAIAARDWPYVGRVVTGQAGLLVLSAHRGQLVRILEQVPPEQLTTTPELMVCGAVLIFHAGDYDAIPARLSYAREQLRRRPESDTRRPAEVMMLTLQLAADRSAGDMPAIVEGCDDLLQLITEDAGTDAAVVARYRAIALNNRGLARLWLGDVGGASRDLWAAIGAARAAGLELVEINAAGHLALLQVWHGSVREAGRLAADARETAARRGWQNTVQAVAAHLAGALVHLERNELGAAEEAAADGALAYHTDPEIAQQIVLSGVQARLAVAAGDAAKARFLLEAARSDRGGRVRLPHLDDWLSEVEAEAGGPGGGDGFRTRVVRAGAALASRDLRLAEDLLATEPRGILPVVTEVEARVVGALVADARGQASRAAELLTAAVSLAEREGVRRPFVTYAGGRLGELLHRLRLSNSDVTAFLDQVDAGIRATGKAARSLGLSEREADVLRCLPTMMTAAEIGAELSISVNTVKAHMRAIYRKLGVARRGEAVVLARENGLI